MAAAVLSTELGPGELLVVQAVAGGGKSTVLREYARARPAALPLPVLQRERSSREDG